MISRDSGAKAPIIEEYSRLAVDYDTRWSFYVEATARETMARLRLRREDRLLDVGCGTGALLHHLAASQHLPRRLVGLDPVPEMLSVARSKLPSEVELREGWAERLPFEDATFDVVVSCNMFHYIRQPSDALAEMLRVLRPNGIVLITDWCDDYLTCKLCDLYLRWVDPSHFRMYGVSKCRELLEAASGQEIEIHRYKISLLWGLMTATARKIHSIPR